MSSALWQNVVGTTARLINFRSEKDTFFVPTFAGERFTAWKEAGYPNADDGIVPFLESIVASGMCRPVWSCIGHYAPERSPWENSGYVTLAGTPGQLLMLERDIYNRFKSEDSGLDNISLEMSRLIHQPNDDWSEVIMYPCLTVRWFGESEDEIKASFGVAQKLLLDAIKATTPEIIR